MRALLLLLLSCPAWGAASPLDEIFKRYAACYGLDPAFLTAIAKKESGLDVWNQTGSLNNGTMKRKYQGLFQMDAVYCEDVFDKAKFPFLNCGNLLDPELNTASAAAGLSRYASKIKAVCPRADAELLVALAYVGHNNGEAVFDRIMEGGASACAIVDPAAGAEPAGQEKLLRDAYRNCSWSPKCAQGKLLKNYRERAIADSCRTRKDSSDDCYVRVKPECQGRTQYELYTRDAVPAKRQGEWSGWTLKAECVPGEGQASEIAKVSRVGAVDEGWGVEKWRVGVTAGREAAGAGAGIPEAALCPARRLHDLDADRDGAISDDEIAAVFPRP